MPEDPTPALLERLHAGDTRALGELLSENLDWVRDHVHKKLGGRVRRLADTGDVVQDVTVNLLKHGIRFVPENRQQFRTLLAVIVTRQLQMLGRMAAAGKRHAAAERPLGTNTTLYLGRSRPAATVLRPDADAEATEAKELISLAMTTLAPLDAATLRMRDGEGKKFEEIGKALGIAEAAARMRYNRAVPRLMLAVTRLRSGDVQAMAEDLENEPTEEP